MNRILAALTLTVSLLVAIVAGTAASSEPSQGEAKFSLSSTHNTPAVDEARIIRLRTERIRDAQVRRFVYQAQVNRFAYATTVHFAAKVEQAKQNAAARARTAAAARDTSDSHVSQPTPVQSTASYGSGACGGALPPCYVMMRESGGSLTAQNPTSTASGKWQFLDSTWAGYGGYSRAMYAPESVQDAKAAALWAGGAGCSHWSAC